MKWMSEKLGIGLSASGDTDNTLTDVGMSASKSFRRAAVTVSGQYNILRNKCMSMARVDYEDTSAKVLYDSKIKDPVVTLSQQLNDVDTVAPTLSLKTGKMSYKWNRRLDSGDVESSYFPGDKVEVLWNDRSEGGSWSTRAVLPLDNPKKCRVSFSRNVNF
jgi:hypothetical protein